VSLFSFNQAGDLNDNGQLSSPLMNACAISPMDSYAYCVASIPAADKTFSKLRLIRFGSQHADPTDAQYEYVAILPSHLGEKGKIPNAAAFAPNGDFHYLYPKSMTAGYYVMAGADRPDKLTGFGLGEYDNAGVHVANPTSKINELSFLDAANSKKNTADLNVVEDKDYDNDGIFEKWGLAIFQDNDGSASPNRVLFVRDPTNTQAPFVAFDRKIEAEAGSKALPTTTPGFGAGWTYKNALYQSDNQGGGVWQILLDTFIPGDESRPVLARYVGESQATTTNDGMNCMNAESPYATCGKNGVANSLAGGVAVTTAQCNAQSAGSVYNPYNAETVCDSDPCDLTGVDFDRCCNEPPFLTVALAGGWIAPQHRAQVTRSRTRSAAPRKRAPRSTRPMPTPCAKASHV